MYTEKEKNIRHIERVIKGLDEDLLLLKSDLSIVSSDKVRKFITDEIDSILRYKDRKEFELWKLKK